MSTINNSTTIKPVFMVLLWFFSCAIFGQNDQFPKSPQQVEFVTSDLDLFWQSFDQIDASKTNPFNQYIEQGSLGVQGFIPHRIVDAKSLLKMVKKRKGDYLKKRGIAGQIDSIARQIKPYFYALEYWYPPAVYPPVYFVFGRFNSGGTISENGLIIGVEKLNDFGTLRELIIHESIHFQQKWPSGKTTLLEQSILEGSADFIAELITGLHGNMQANKYGNANKDRLCKEFVGLMNKKDYTNWLYGTSGKDDRPNDLGYWIGYEICKSYYEKQKDKQQAVANILNIEDYQEFLKQSGFLEAY